MTDATAAAGRDGAAAGIWLSAQEAMMRLQVSERTLFRRIARGHLLKRIRTDGRIEVWVTTPFSVDGAILEEMPAPEPEPLARPAADDSERSLMLVERFGELMGRQMDPLLREMAVMRQEIQHLAEENGRLKAQLEFARQQPLNGHMTVTDSQRSRRGWQFWRL
jgi:hypothetical protein